MGFTKRELIEFLDELVELASEENKVKAVLAKEKFVSDFENTYGYEKEVITEITKLPPHYIAAMPDAVQEEIRQKVIAALTEHGECTPENVDRAMSSKIYTFSKEFGLSGVRVGIIVGNPEFIDMIRYHNYEMNVMIPSLNQRIACTALERIEPSVVKEKITASMDTLVTGFWKLGWEDLEHPQAGISFLLPAPKKFIERFGEEAGELFAFHMQKDFGVGVGPAKCNCLEKGKYIRILSMEPADTCLRMFERINKQVSPDMQVPDSLFKEYREILKEGKMHNVR